MPTRAGAQDKPAEKVPEDVRKEIEAVLQKKVADLVSQKNAQGILYKRGSFSRALRRLDGGTYQVSFHQDTAGAETLTTERYLLTLEKDASGKWAIANEELKQKHEGLHRSQIDHGSFYDFSGFSFDREGLKVSATNGAAYIYSYQGKPSGILLASSDLAYSYGPPADLDVYQVAKQRLLKEHPEDFVFRPEAISITCDAVSCQNLIDGAFKGLEEVGKGTEGARTLGGKPLEKRYTRYIKDIRDLLKDNPFALFRLPDDPDRRRWFVAVYRDSAKDHAIGLAYDTDEPWEVSFGAAGYGTIFAYYAEDVRKSEIPAYDLEQRDDSDARDFDLESIKGWVELALGGEDKVTGDVTYGMTIKRDLRELPFRISRWTLPTDEAKDAKNPRMFVNSLQDGKGNDLAWVKTSAFGGLVLFPEIIPAGTKLTLRLEFTNLDSIRKLNPSYSEMDRSGWLPFVRFTDMIKSFDLVTKVPAKYTVLGVGKRESETVKEGVRTSRWVSKNPVSFPTVIFGDYIEPVGAPDFPAQKRDGTEIPVRVYVDKVSSTALDTRVLETYGTQKDFEEFQQRAASGSRDIRGKQLKSIAEQAANALNLYREIYGVDYPYDKLDLVADPQGSFYGQAPASIVYLGFGVFRGEGAVAAGSLFGGGADLSRFNKDVVAHEVGHQWWGSLINNANDRNYWFVESLAEYSSALFVEAVNSDGGKNPAKGRKAYLDKVAEWRRLIMDTDLLASVQSGFLLYGGELPGQSYVANVYNKGPYAFHTLRETFGDEKFFAFLKMLVSELKGQGIVTRDIQMVAEKSFGGTMDWFFDQWLRGVGLPQYALFYQVRKTEDGKYLVEGTIKQRVLAGSDKKELPGVYHRAVAPLTFITHKGKQFESKPMLVQGPETPFKLKIADEPAEVLFNRNGQILAYDVLVNRNW